MRRFKFAKLVRDKIVDDMLANGQKPKYRVLSGQEYIDELKRKVLEEAQEIPLDDGDDIKEKLADIQEVIDSLLKALKVKKGQIKILQAQKNQKRGSFRKKIYVELVEVAEDFKWLDYYLKFPQKYPELKKNRMI